MGAINGADQVTYSKGCDLTSGTSSDRDAAVQAAKDADQVVRACKAQPLVTSLTVCC